jgi:hypothetical protein
MIRKECCPCRSIDGDGYEHQGDVNASLAQQGKSEGFASFSDRLGKGDDGIGESRERATPVFAKTIGRRLWFFAA